MHQQNEPTTNELADAHPAPPVADWDSSGGTAVAEVPAASVPPVERTVSAPAGPQQAPPQSEAVNRAQQRRSTSTLGGTFASIIFHLWLLSVLATLTGSPPLRP